MRRICILFLQFISITFALCELSESKDKYINALVNHLNGLPDQPFVYDEADLLKALEISDKEYYVEIRVKALEQNNASSKYQNCTGTLNIDGDGQILVKECQCADFPENLEELVIDATTVDGPIQLENEVQTENISTSGEQFIAVPRDKPAPCIGCATIVDPAASGVHELATLGVRQLDRHEPNTRHALNNVLLVERQVQVVGGVRYIMTLTIDYDNCTTNESNDCIVQKTCRISVLEKPWQKLPDGSKFRAIVSNNCTDEWLFGENGPSEPNLNNQSNDIGNPTSQYDPTGVGDDIVKAIHNVEVQAQPATEKVLTEYQIKELEEQIIPNVKVDQTTNNVVSGPTQMPITEVKFTTLDAAKPIEHIPSKHLEINKIEPGLPEDKKKTIDELINFFDFAGFKDKEVHDEIIRMKRDYGSDLKMLNVAENYQDMKTKLKNAQFIKKLALVMVNHINEMDIEARTRVFKEVISAEEETEKDQRYFYIKARVSLPCHKPVCKNEEFNICDGIIDVSGEQPSVLYTVCNAKPKINLGKLKNVPEKDTILLKFLKRALTKIDVESKNPYALRIRNILSATTQRVSGTLTKITVEIEYTECFKSVPLLKRKNCTALENLGYKVCDIEVVERHWLKESKLTYTCTDRPVDEMFVSVPHQLNLDDPKIHEVVQEALQNLELKSNRNNKQKLIEVKSVSTKQVAGVLINVVFTVGYTTCPSEFKDDVNTCELLENEPLRKCSVEVWERAWLDEERRQNISCEELSINVDSKIDSIQKIDSKKSMQTSVKEIVKDPSEYSKLADDCLTNYIATYGINQHYKVVKMHTVVKENVSSDLTTIDFEAAPTNCTAKNGYPTSSSCSVQGSAETLSCHAEVMTNPQLNTRMMKVNCLVNTKEFRRKREVLVGGKTTQDPKNPRYMELAERSLTKYVRKTRKSQYHKVVTIQEVKTQVVSGIKTIIQFKASPTNCEADRSGMSKGNSQLCVIEDSSVVLSCFADIYEQPWMGKEEIDVSCHPDRSRVKRDVSGSKSDQRRLLGGLKEKDVSDPTYTQLAKESLAKYVSSTGSTDEHTVIKINKVQTQVVAGTKTIIDFTVQGPANVFECHSKVWEQPWLNKKEIDVKCNPTVSRQKRQVPGGPVDQDVTDPKYKQLAEESLAKYVSTTGSNEQHKVIEIKKVHTQVVSGKMTIIDFTVQGPANVFKCHSKVWEQPWLNKKEIDVKCDPTNKRQKRQVPGGPVDQDVTDPKYKQLAEESLAKYVSTTGSNEQHKVIEIKKVQTQVVSGKKTIIDFTVQGPGNVFECNSEVWEQPWLKKKDITVKCSPVQLRHRREVQLLSVVRNINRVNNVHSTGRKSGGQKEEDPTEPKYAALATEALRRFEKRKRSQYFHKVVTVDHVVTQVVSGQKILIDFTSSPTTCPSNATNEALCDIITNTTLYCRAEVWDRPWLKKKKINVFCNYENDDEEIDSVENMRKKRSLSSKSDLEIKNYIDKSEKTDTPVEVVNGEVEKVPSKKVDNSYLQKEMFYNSKHYLKAAEEALREYEIRSKSDVVYKVVKIHYVNEEDDVGVRARLDFTASPSNCTKTNYTNIDYCEFLDPKELISCHADLRLTMMLDNNMMKNYDVKCIQRKKKTTHSGEMGKVRNIRQMPLDENVEDDLMYYYADRVLSKLNIRFAGDNLYKLITVHDIRRTVHMKTPLVRMYLEVGKTLCLRDDPEVELSTCNEIDGLTHLLCYARLWPSIYDDIVLERTEVVCEDELQKFSPLAGFHTNDLLVVSMYVLNRDGGDRYFLRSVGNPHLSPTLDYNKPFRLSFIVVETNCTKEFVATIDTYSRDILSKCPTNERETLRQCHSQIYITPNSRTLRYVNVSCNVNPKSRTRRSISLNPRNITKEDVTIQKFIQEALQQLEMVSVVKYKQRVLVINRYSTKTAASKQTTIDFDVGYTNCLKYEWVDNITSCEFLEHLPRRHCVAVVTERLWSDSGRQTEVNCEDDETPLEANMELETAQSATTLAKEALKRIEYKYPHPRRQIVVRIFSLDKQMVAGVHYRLKMEVGYSTCMALSEEEDCKLDPLIDQRKFCRVNVWLRSWTNHPPSYRVSCDYQDGAVSEIFHQIQAQELFYHFMARHKPSYLDDHEEMQKRFAIFTQNVKKIHELNVYEMGTARYAVTQHADLTAEEFRKKYLGLDVSLRDENQLPMPEAAIPDVSLPDSFDWRDHDAVTEVKNQGGCGSCWAFSVTGNIEGQWKRHSGKLVSLSEQELVDCDKLDNGCNGGLPDNAYRAIEQLGGLELEADYPYEAEDDKCAFNKTLSRVQISGAVNISSNETNMAKWLVQNGPISIGINANAMQFYVGGISHPWKMLCNPSNLDHGVLIVGYGIKNYPLFNKKLPYWIVKNSWGPTWGEQGYYRVYRGDGTCGVNQMASSAVI